jgi:hypothetical protein
MQLQAQVSADRELKCPDQDYSCHFLDDHELPHGGRGFCAAEQVLTLMRLRCRPPFTQREPERPYQGASVPDVTERHHLGIRDLPDEEQPDTRE